jgi:hypothetical protein
MSTAATAEPVINRRQLGRLATDAALELNSFVKGRNPSFNSVPKLATHLRSRIDSAESTAPAALVSSDLGVMAALSRALESTGNKAAKDTDELTRMTDGMAVRLEGVSPGTDVGTAALLRDFCLSLASRLCMSGFEHLERRPLRALLCRLEPGIRGPQRPADPDRDHLQPTRRGTRRRSAPVSLRVGGGQGISLAIQLSRGLSALAPFCTIFSLP